MSEDEEKDYTYLLGVSDYGLEYLRDVTDHFSEERMHLDFALQIAGEETNHADVDRAITFVSLRARFNSQRNYEAFLLRTSVTEKELVKHFDARPEAIRALIRRKGIPVR